nr:hypothetical protein [uncultured Blautia sp.]
MKEPEVTANRCFKSRLFVMVFEDKRELLKLYNAVSGKNYQNPELLEINTLDNAIYMSMRNDLSFIIDSRMPLYEHQSSYNPNLPLRFLLYNADVFSGLTKDENLYGTKLVRLPTPQFIVFYNGEKELPDRMELKLSDAYTVKEEEVSLELKAVMLNINPGHNEKILEACKTLREYTEYTSRVREYTRTMDLEAAVERAITECIQEGILEEFLKKNRAEAKSVSIYEYDMEKHMRMEREDAREDGIQEGIFENRTEIIQKMLSLKRYSYEEIAEIVNLSVEEIHEIEDQNLSKKNK